MSGVLLLLPHAVRTYMRRLQVVCIVAVASCPSARPPCSSSPSPPRVRSRPSLPHRYLGLGSYCEWEEEKRLAFLTAELGSKRPLVPPSMPFTPDAQEVVDTLK